MADEVVGLVTLQFHSGGLLQSKPVDNYKVHLVRSTARGTPGPTLCGIDRFAPGSAGWSVGGGVTPAGHVFEACPGCALVRDKQFPSLPVSGTVGAYAYQRSSQAEVGS